MSKNQINSLVSSEQLAEIREQMLKFARLQLQDSAQAEDIVQETLLSAVKNIDKFKRKAALKTWFFAILKNKLIDFLRKKERYIVESELTSEEDNNFFDSQGHWKMEYSPLDWQENTVYSDEFWLLFEACLTKLPARQSRVFMMREYLDISSEEICRTIDISRENLHTLLYRARLQLQQCLSKILTTGE
ncbi:sigma-70 family RNA polymerase sigma factor [Caviibacterium pharyngocola]|uniref:RNA polymerase subunit sigma n=1 Tax=Caviibacterium pharyngocola TaxID=28159 RepID=A0A2M8RYX4_9PAST|nr:sigma-70 family RNA polymerase sigma factor [Caviibacterium pharyngocola]PJG84078.1 RNA polymerase subunit sigma [Caviibacterium pharyngocola]